MINCNKSTNKILLDTAIGIACLFVCSTFVFAASPISLDISSHQSKKNIRRTFLPTGNSFERNLSRSHFRYVDANDSKSRAFRTFAEKIIKHVVVTGDESVSVDPALAQTRDVNIRVQPVQQENEPPPIINDFAVVSPIADNANKTDLCLVIKAMPDLFFIIRRTTKF